MIRMLPVEFNDTSKHVLSYLYITMCWHFSLIWLSHLLRLIRMLSVNFVYTHTIIVYLRCCCCIIIFYITTSIFTSTIISVIHFIISLHIRPNLRNNYVFLDFCYCSVLLCQLSNKFHPHSISQSILWTVTYLAQPTLMRCALRQVAAHPQRLKAPSQKKKNFFYKLASYCPPLSHLLNFIVAIYFQFGTCRTTKQHCLPRTYLFSAYKQK